MQLQVQGPQLSLVEYPVSKRGRLQYDLLSKLTCMLPNCMCTSKSSLTSYVKAAAGTRPAGSRTFSVCQQKSYAVSAIATSRQSWSHGFLGLASSSARNQILWVERT